MAWKIDDPFFDPDGLRCRYQEVSQEVGGKIIDQVQIYVSAACQGNGSRSTSAFYGMFRAYFSRGRELFAPGHRNGNTTV